MRMKHNLLIKLQIKLDFLYFQSKAEILIDIKRIMVILRLQESKNLKILKPLTSSSLKESLGSNFLINAIIPELVFPPLYLKFQLTVGVPLHEKVRQAIITVWETDFLKNRTKLPTLRRANSRHIVRPHLIKYATGGSRKTYKVLVCNWERCRRWEMGVGVILCLKNWNKWKIHHLKQSHLSLKEELNLLNILQANRYNLILVRTLTQWEILMIIRPQKIPFLWESISRDRSSLHSVNNK